MRARGEGVLLARRDAGLGRGVLGVRSHVHVAGAAPEAVLDHAVDHGLIADLHAAPHAVHVVRRVAHALLTAGDDDLRVAGLDGLRRQHDGLEPRAAHLVDGDARRRWTGRRP